jgi:hypothetical protein
MPPFNRFGVDGNGVFVRVCECERVRVVCVAGIAFDRYEIYSSGGCVGRSVGSQPRIWQAKQGVVKREGEDHPKWTNGQNLFTRK